MWFSWSFWFAQRIQVHLSLAATRLSPSRALCDGQPCPDLSSGELVLGSYCDNVNVLGVNADSVAHHKLLIVRKLQEFGFPVHEERGPESLAVSLGLVIDGVTGRVEPTSKRLLSVISAMRYVASRPRLSGKQLE